VHRKVECTITGRFACRGAPFTRLGVRTAGRGTHMEEYLLVFDDDILTAVNALVELIAGLLR
jgi:hypothetical protein